MFPCGVNLLTDSNLKLMRQPHWQLTGLCRNSKVFEVFWQLTISTRLLLQPFIIKHSFSSHKQINHDSSKRHHSRLIYSGCFLFVNTGWAACPIPQCMLQSTALRRTQKCVTLRSLWMMGVLRWCSRETASQVSQKICSTSASVKPVCSLWFIKLTTCPPEKWYPIIRRHNKSLNFKCLIPL